MQKRVLTGDIRGLVVLQWGGALAAQFAELVVEGVVEFFHGPLYGLLKGFGLVGNGERLQPFGPGLDLAALVLCASLLAIIVVQMNDDTGQLIVEAFQLAGNTGTHPFNQAGTTFNVVIAVNLDLHKAFLLQPFANSVASRGDSTSLRHFPPV